MKYILRWLQGWLEMAAELSSWFIFAPYYKAITMNKVRAEIKLHRKEYDEAIAKMNQQAQEISR